jgi:hypothetical protein
MSQRKLGSFFVSTPRQNGSTSLPPRKQQLPQQARDDTDHMHQQRGKDHHEKRDHHIQQQQQQPAQLQKPLGSHHIPLSGQKRKADDEFAVRSSSRDMHIDTPERPVAPQRPPNSARRPEMLEARRRRMHAILSDPETKNAAALRQGSSLA